MFDFKFSDIGEGLHEGTILKWHIKVGDIVKEGDLLVEVETDKVNAELTAPVGGTITKLGKPEGEIINVGETVVLIAESNGDISLETENTAPKQDEPTPTLTAAPGVIGEIEVDDNLIGSTKTEQNETRTAKALATPVARKMAKDLGVDINNIKGSGISGRVMKEDILAAHEGAKKPTSPPPISIPSIKVEGQVERVKISGLRRSIVKAMRISKANIPHTVLMDEVLVDDLVKYRKAVKEDAAKRGIKLTYMPFIIKAVSIALKEHPVLNASFDAENEEIIFKNFMNIGIAVDTPDGLIAPNIKDADRKSILTLASELETLAEATRQRKLKQTDLSNTTFTITNFGSVGIAHGTPIINYPEVGILGIGMIKQKPVVIDGEIRIAYVLPLSIAVDHRIIDGADAGRFLNRVKELLHDPQLLLLS